MLDWIVDLATSAWAYLVTAVVVLVDGVVGIVPAEAVLHAAGVGASRGDDPVLLLLIAVAALAAIAGDFVAYSIGARWGTTLRDRFIRSDRVWSSEKTQRRFEAVRGQLDERPWIITVARFVPTLRTVTMYSAGSLSFPRRRFVLYEAPGAVAWAAYNVLLGYFLGRVFSDASFWVPFAVSLGIGLVLSLVFEALRRARIKTG